MKLIAGAGKLVLFFAVMSFITAASLFVVGGYLATWPILRQSPRTQRKRAIMQLTVSLLALAQAFGPDAGGPGAE